MASKSYDPTRDPRSGRPPLPIDAEKARAEAGTETQEDRPPPKSASKAGGNQRPEALAQFAESARDSETSPKHLDADGETAPIPTDNTAKHDVATKLLNEGAHGKEPDPDAAGEDRLPDRITRENSDKG
jgi:hypothetical protein